MGRSIEAAQLEQELMRLFHETAYRVVKKPCRGKYRGYNDYFLEFGSGRTIYISTGWRNYLPKLREHLGYIRYFRAHQAENTARVKAALAAHNAPFCDAAVEIVPYDGKNDLTLYAVVILTHQSGIKIRYRTTNLHYVLVNGDNRMDTFDSCMEHLLQDSCGEMAYCTVHDAGAFEKRPVKRPAHKRKEELTR